MKLLWVSDDYRCKTGYGRVSRELFPFISKKYDIIHFAIHCQGLSSDYYVIDSKDGIKKICSVIDTLKPDIVILMNDSNTVYNWLSYIKDCKYKTKIIPYVATEYIGIPELEVDLYNKTCSGLLTMANFTIEDFKKNGCNLISKRLSHGYSIEKMEKNKAKQILNISEDTFVFFSGNKNQPRKRLDIIIRAYVELLKKHSDKKMLLMFNCGLIDSGWDLKHLYSRLCKENNIQNKENYIYFCSDDMYGSNKNEDELKIIYNACDVGINTSTGEAFGLVSFEQSYLGIPQIIPNWGGIIESTQHGCIKIEPNDYYVYPVAFQNAGGESITISYKDVFIAMEMYLLDKELYNLHCNEVINNVTNYSWEEISSQLIEFLENVI